MFNIIAAAYEDMLYCIEGRARKVGYDVWDMCNLKNARRSA